MDSDDYIEPDYLEKMLEPYQANSSLDLVICNYFNDNNPKVVCPDNLTVGEHCSLNEGSLLHCVGNVVLGNNVTVSAGAKIFSTQYDVSHWTESEKHYHLRKSVFINDGCWICSGGVILPGVYINGKNVIVGANAVVTRDINESNVLVAGVPAKIVKKYE